MGANPVTAGGTPANRPPLVSVVIAFLDGERFLREAIDSVFAQTYERWELLLVDDGSGPAASSIARECAAREPGRVRYLEHDEHRNRGLSASRNLGIAGARGVYTAFLDADDVWLPDKLMDQVAILESRPMSERCTGTRCTGTAGPETRPTSPAISIRDCA